MSIEIHLDVLLAQRKIRAKELAKAMNMTEAQLSKVKNGHMVGIKFETLDRLCELLDCQPGDLFEHIPNKR